MHKEPNKKKVGLFVLIGLIAFFGIVLNFVWDKLFPNNDNLIVMYFDESVKGLSVGSPVVFKGVEIGKVTHIDLLGNPETLTFNIPVYVRFAKSQNIVEVARHYRYRKALLNAFIEKGLRARLINQSLLTGQLMIELEVLPKTPIVLKSPDPEVLEIPTVLSPIEQLSQDIQTLPLRTTLVRLNEVLDKLDKGLDTILPDMQKITSVVRVSVEKNVPQTDMTLNNFNQTLQSISDAAKSIRNFADYMERHPEALLKGKDKY